MSRRVLLSVTAFVIIGILTITFFPFRSLSKPGFIKVDPAFAAYVSGYTSGIISNESKIRIRLTNDYNGSITFEKPITEKYFQFDPAIEGETFWIDSRTLEFRPAKRLASGQRFICDFFLSKLIPNLPENLQTMRFDFMTMQQDFEVVDERIRTTDLKDYHLQRLEGLLSTADAADSPEIERILTAEQDGKSKHIRWEHDGDHVTHHFYIDSIVRGSTEGKITLKWDGASLGITTSGSKDIIIPKLDEFKVTGVKTFQGNEQYVAVQFSDPILTGQNLDGLITLDESASLRYTIDGNEIKVYPSVAMTGSHRLVVSSGIKNTNGKAMPQSYQETIVFEELKPAVELVGNGVILPNTPKGLTFPFRAVGLRSVDVKIIRIFENNVLQFLQVNNIDGDREISRVGRTVLKKTVPLAAKSQLDYNHWSNYSLDLGQLIKAEPGAIYKVSISFKKAYATYTCTGNDAVDQSLTTIDTETDDENSDDVSYYNDYYYDYDYYYGDDYDDYYSNRENPCHDAYYRNKVVSRNVLASDLGLIAKRGNDGGLSFAVTNLLTTAPIQGTTIELYDYQQQLLGTLTTDKDGFASTNMKRKPYVLVAKNGTQRGYLRIDDGSSLSYSAFDVSGEEVQKGLKGFIYGERGVWRPGDTLFLSFILEDKTHQLPATHPVTFELMNPRGQVVDKIIKSVSVNGFYNFTTTTSEDAPTGNWTARVKVGGATFTKDLKIETIMPNRMKLDLDFGKQTVLHSGNATPVNLDVKWLTGAVASNLKTKVEVNLYQSTTTFKGYDGYTFDDAAKNFNTESRTLFDGSIDASGHASFTPQIEAADAPGMVRASFYTRVFEEGGAFSTDRRSITLSPFESYVGVKAPAGKHYGNMLVTDTTHTFNVATVDENGKAVSRNGVTVDIYKLDWRWWWSGGEDDLAQYVGSTYRMPVFRDTINTVNGKSSFNYRLNYPEWGRYYVRVTDPVSGHTCGSVVYFDWPAWAGSAMKNSEAATMLAITSDHESYKVGEKIKVNIPSGAEGRALVTVESGSKIIETHWVMAQKPAITYEIPVTSEMAPGIYVSVTLIQPHANTTNDAPIRLYGVIPVKVDDPNTHLSPQIACADVWRPETETSITVSEKTGKAMTYTLAIVDEGLLDLTHFETPDPWNRFYAREALGVKTWDMFDLVMGAYGAQLERVLAIGGDLDGSGKGGESANRFKPMVRFIGPYHLDANKKTTHKIALPQYVGSVRVMVVAGYEGAYGNAEKQVYIRKPLMVLGTLPRVVGPGETVDLPVSVFAMENKVKNVSVSITTLNLLTLQEAGTKSISFQKIGDQLVNFSLKVDSRIGVGRVRITATGAGEKAVQDIELNVRNPNPEMTTVIEGIADAGKTFTSAYTPAGMAGTNEGYVEVSSIPAINLGSRLQYLIQYPHGCVEQTTSSVFPQLYLSQLMVLDTVRKKTISDNIKAGIVRLTGFQTSSGGFSYWPGESEPSEWGSNYAGHFLIEAQKKGYAVSSTMIDNWKSFQRNAALNWTRHIDRSVYYNDELDQAYRLYTLALAGAPELSAMNRLKSEKTLSATAKWRLAAAYQLAGQNDVATKMVAGLTTTVASYTELSYTFGSSDRDEAMILETLSLLNERVKAATLMKTVAAQLSNSSMWMSTQTTAYCLIAISKYAGAGNANGTLNYSCTINGAVTNVNSKMPVSQTEMKISGANAGTVTVKNNGSASLYVRIILRGTPETGDQTEAENNLTMSVRFTKTDGTLLTDVSKLTQGTDFIAEVTIGNPGLRGEYKELALTQIFASGWEIHNTRMDDVSNTALRSDSPTYQDIRDDRVYTYFDLQGGRSKTFRIQLNASYTGKFYLPSFYCEAMYDNTINAHRAGKWVEVQKAGGGGA